MRLKVLFFSFERGLPGLQLQLRQDLPRAHQPTQRRRGRAHGVAQATARERGKQRGDVTRSAVVSAGRELAEVLKHAGAIGGAVSDCHG